MSAQLRASEASDTEVLKPRYRMSAGGNEKPTCSIGPQMATPAPLKSVTLVGDLNTSTATDIQLRLKRPLNLELEDDEDGGAIVSDFLFGVYGEGKDFNAAIKDYRSALMDFYLILRERSECSSEDAVLYAAMNRYIEEMWIMLGLTLNAGCVMFEAWTARSKPESRSPRNRRSPSPN